MLMTRLDQHSGTFAQWFSIVRVAYPHCLIPGLILWILLQIPLGFGNAVVLQTTLGEFLS
jgi:hypothetical protein